MTTTRTIIHVDLDQFFCAVEEQRDPTLRGTPFAVGGRPEGRGVLASASYAARAFGVRSAMPMAHAVRLCPELTVVRPNFPAYRAASQQVMERLHGLTELVEQISIDEAFLDVSALGEAGEQVARRLQAAIRHELGLSCSIGVATNKLVAKIATDVGKGMAPAIDWAAEWNGTEEISYQGATIRYTTEVLTRAGDRVRFEQRFAFPDETLVSFSELRFMPKEAITARLSAAGLVVEALLGDWDASPFDPTSSHEMIFVARPVKSTAANSSTSQPPGTDEKVII
jgi:hypothetical protein